MNDRRYAVRRTRTVHQSQGDVRVVDWLITAHGVHGPEWGQPEDRSEYLRTEAHRTLLLARTYGAEPVPTELDVIDTETEARKAS